MKGQPTPLALRIRLQRRLHASNDLTATIRQLRKSSGVSKATLYRLAKAEPLYDTTASPVRKTVAEEPDIGDNAGVAELSEALAKTLERAKVLKGRLRALLDEPPPKPPETTECTNDEQGPTER